MDSDKPTNPNISEISQEELMSKVISSLDYLIGRVRAIEVMLLSTPPWAEKLIERQTAIEKNCKLHSNGHGQTFLFDKKIG